MQTAAQEYLDATGMKQNSDSSGCHTDLLSDQAASVREEGSLVGRSEVHAPIPIRYMRMFMETNTGSPLWDAGPEEYGPIEVADLEMSSTLGRALREWAGQWEDEFDRIGQVIEHVDPVRYEAWYVEGSELCGWAQEELGNSTAVTYDQDPNQWQRSTARVEVASRVPHHHHHHRRHRHACRRTPSRGERTTGVGADHR